MGSSDHGTTYVRVEGEHGELGNTYVSVGGDDGEIRTWHFVYEGRRGQ